MNSLYHALLVQHPKQLIPVRCAEQTILQLHRYFEDVVLENSLSSLVIESLPSAAERPLRDLARVRELGRAAQAAFFFVSPEDALHRLPLRAGNQDREAKLLPSSEPEHSEERFVVIADSRFSGLLASVRDTRGGAKADGDEVVWTFEPDVVYTALEYLMARVTAERPLQSPDFISAVRASMPKATSLQLTVSVTTKLARMLQEQAGREIAINRIATAIRNSLELDDILQTTVDEVGRALGVLHCALAVNGEANGPRMSKIYFRDHAGDAAEEAAIMAELDAYSVRLASQMQTHVLDGRTGADEHSSQVQPLAVVPIIYQARFMGALMVRSDDPSRCWQETELLLLRTVADQVIMAVDHARLFAQTQQQALTDVLTGCFNRRSFEMQLDRELRTARRDERIFSVVMCDLDNFKRVNDTFGHDAGDVALRMVGETFREELRGRDTAARYGGEEFAIVLPDADGAEALVVAERLRARLAKLDIPGVGSITASFGLASFPERGSTRDQLVGAADRALYEAKHLGRNRVVNSVPAHAGAETAEPSTVAPRVAEEANESLVAPESVESTLIATDEPVAETDTGSEVESPFPLSLDPGSEIPDEDSVEPSEEAIESSHEETVAKTTIEPAVESQDEPTPELQAEPVPELPDELAIAPEEEFTDDPTEDPSADVLSLDDELMHPGGSNGTSSKRKTDPSATVPLAAAEN
jgi:diguanylate cyclase (GGDEF)-like protein